MDEKGKKAAIHHLKPGTILNKKYLVGNVLGEGGFGITYVGLDTTLDIKVAIKEYYPNGYVNRNNENSHEITVTTDQQKDFFNKGKERFLVEARSIAKFSREKGVVDVRDYFEENGTAYIIMEFLDGQTLGEYAKQNGNMSAKELFELMLPVMKSLRKMHSEGVIHRDISPDNIMFLKDGGLMLMDFGSARYYNNEEKMLSVVLKLGYAPEEQYRKNGVQGPWTDVYGMCATMYRCITGKVPEDALDRLHTDNLKKPSELKIEIPKTFEAILMYGLAVHKENRCKDMDELIRLTEKALKKEEISFTPQKVSDDEIYKTRAADEDYRTMVAESLIDENTTSPTYGDNFKGTGYSGYPTDFQNGRNNSGYNNGYNSYNNNNNNKNSSAKVIIAVIITLCILVTTVCATLLVLSINDASDDDTDNQSQSQQENKNEENDNQENDDVSVEAEDLQAAQEFTRASASSVLPDQKGYTYSASNALENDSDCWCEDSSGYGEGEWIKFELPEVQMLSGVRIINGYAGTKDQYEHNSKVKDITMEFSNGMTATATLKEFDSNSRKTVQVLEFSEPIETSYVKIIIDSVIPGECEDTCLTYVAPY